MGFRRRLLLPMALLLVFSSLASVGVNAVPASASIRPDATPTGKRNNWPCTGCVTDIPKSYDPSKPAAIVVALHGDEGISDYIYSSWAPVTEKANVILFAPQCPTNEGCRFSDGGGGFTNSWWGWVQSSSYDDAWIGKQVDTIQKSYNLDKSREYLTGWSGGADFLGWYALQHADRFAAANFVVGGVPYHQNCPSKKIAVYFLMGSNDFRYQSGQPSQVRGILQGCGSVTKMVVLPGHDHQSTIDSLTSQGYATKILKWMMKKKLGS